MAAMPLQSSISIPSQQGGSRPNSGRKPIGDQPMVTRAFVITREQATWIETIAEQTGDNYSEVVRRALAQAMEPITS